VDRCDAYRHSAARCVELARRMDSPRDRLVLLEMALVWSRLAAYAAKTAARNECPELEASSNPAHWVKAVKREAEEDWGRQ
jgi:hypothetical protein